MEVMSQLEHIIGLCIIDAVPAGKVSGNPFSLADTERELKRLNKEIEFMEGIRSAKTGEKAKDMAAAFRRNPSQDNADQLRDVFDEYLEHVSHDTQMPLWTELVSGELTMRALKQMRLLEMQVAALDDGAVAASLDADAAPSKPNPMPSTEAVEFILYAIRDLDSTLLLCLKDAQSPKIDRTKHISKKEATRMRERLLKERRFGSELTMTDVMEDVAIATITYLRSPSPGSANSMYELMEEFVTRLESDMETPLWQELVSPAHTNRALEQLQQVKTEIAQL